MFSLDWVKDKAQVMGSAHLINDYVEYGEMLDKEVLDYIILYYTFNVHITILIK